MKKKIWIYLISLLVIPGLLLTVSCAKKTVKTDTAVSEAPSETGPAPTTETARPAEQGQDRQPASSPQAVRGRQTGEAGPTGEDVTREDTRPLVDVQRKVFLGELVLFEYDRSILTPEAQERLIKKAQYMKNHPNVKVTIEGHCDERGTGEYNLVLGERRAEAARDFLVDLGVPAGRLSTISYGEERPFVQGSNENAWSLNRRAHFVVQ